MSEETDHDKEDLKALDSVLRKYSACSVSKEKKGQGDSEGASDIPSDLQPPTKSFLQEIQERAEILSCQRERSAKQTLHTVVAQDVETAQPNLDDFVKLIRSALIAEEPQSTSPSQSPAPKLDTPSSSYPGSFDYLNTEAFTSKPTLWDLEAEENKGHLPDSDSEPTSTEETDTDSDTGSDASELNFTWEVNTELPDRDTEESFVAAEANPRGYFQVDALEEIGPSAGHISEGYFQLSALDDSLTLDMADGEPPIPLPEGDKEQLQRAEDDGVLSLSDDEVFPADKEEEVAMEVDDSKKSFKATLGDEKVLDGFIDDVTDKQNNAGTDQGEVVSGDETTKVPSEDGDWVLLPKSQSIESRPMDVEVTDDGVEKDDADHQDKKRKTDEEKETCTEEEEVSKDGDALMEKSKDEAESEEEEADDRHTPPEDTPDKAEDDDDGNKEKDDTVVLRQKPHGAQAIHPQQRYSLPEFAVFDNAKRLDIEMHKSRAKLGKQGALAQRRKPTKPSNLDPSRRQTWMFGDPNDTRALFELDGIEEESEKSRTKGSRLSAPVRIEINRDEDEEAPPKPKKPIGGIGSPMLLAGLGGPAKLKKTPRKSPLEDKPLALPPQEKPPVKTEPPRILKPKPARPTPASRPPKPNQPPSWANKPKPKPRPSEEKPNNDILGAQKENEVKEDVPKVPSWMQEKRLPPISPRSDEAPNKEKKPPKKPAPIPQWKLDLMKKKKETEPGKRHSMPPPVAKKPEPGAVPFTTMPQWQVDLAEKKHRKKKEGDMPSAEIEIKDEPLKVPAWKREAAERAERVKKAQEARTKKALEEKAKEEKTKEEKEKKEESAPLSPMQTTPTVTIISKKDSSEEEEEKKDKPKSPSWKEEANEKTQKNKDTENKAPKVPSKKPVLTPKPKPSQVQLRPANDDVPQWKKDLVKKRRTSDWRSRLRSASIDQNSPPSPTSKTNEESNKLNDSENEQNSSSDKNKETKRHTICTITDLPVKIPRNPPPSNVPQWKLELERRNRRLADHLANKDSGGLMLTADSKTGFTSYFTR